MNITGEFLLVVISLMGLAGGVFSAFNRLGQRVAIIETHLLHIIKAVGAHPSKEKED